ncbi:MAG: aquaporin, partial [Bacteroidota bacterium]
AIFFTTNPLAISALLMGMIYAGGPISKAHYNPAVTLAFWWRKQCAARDVTGYLVAQIAAALLAAGVASSLLPQEQLGPAAFGGVGPALAAEAIGTFALVFVILHVATTERAAGNEYYGLAIGMTVLGCAEAFGGISGGAFNPAVAIGAAAAGVFSWSVVWVHFLASFAASGLAVLVVNYTEK